MKIATARSQALQLGQRRYFTGKPCPHGHIADRHTVLGDCCVCRNLKQNQRKREQRAALRAKGPAV